MTATAVAALALAGCGSGAGDKGTDTGAESGDKGGTEAPAGKTEVTMAGWSLATTPEFQLLVDGFNASQDEYEVVVKEYDANDYDTQLVADLGAGVAPDVLVLKNLKMFFEYQKSGSLVDVTDVVDSLPAEIQGTDPYAVDNQYYAIPYRQDGWLLYYNAEMFKAAGVDLPDGTWTWENYEDAAKKIAEATGKKGAYQHSWQSVVQAFALAQVPGADFLSGDYEYMTPYYERTLEMQNNGSIVDFGSITTNQLTYQGQFGTQEAAMMPMGSWYVATLLAQQKSGEADTFEWGIAPAPQLDASTTGLDKTPITFGNPTGMGINAKASAEKIEGAKKFLAYAGSEELAIALAGIGITPAYLTPAVSDAFFAMEGVPQDELTKFAWSNRDVRLEQPASEYTAQIENILKDMHSEILTGGSEVAPGIQKASDQVTSEVLGN